MVSSLQCKVALLLRRASDTGFSVPIPTPIVSNMENVREWDVTIRGRIEHVTDVDSFPEMLRTALAAESQIAVVQFDDPIWPHTTTVTIRVAADRKKDAERTASELMLPILKSVANSIIGDQPFGWALGLDAVPVSKIDASRSIPN
jgi:hypothetical protein